MKLTLAVVAAFALGLCSLRAQTPVLQSALNLSADQYAALTNSVEQTDPIPADGAPVVGMFYSAQNPAQTPLPGNFNNLPAWDLGNMVYLLDDFGFDPRDAFGRRSKDDGSPPPPGAGGGGGGEGYTNTFHYSFDTNGLWLEMTSVSNGLSYLNLHNATNQVYAIWSTTDVMSEWNVETEVWPTNPSVMPFAVLTSNRPNLYMQAEDWTGMTNNGNTTPDWWFWMYFANFDLLDTNLDSQGRTLLYDYEHGADPNVISFNASVTNYYVNSTNMPAQLNIAAGWPYYMAVAVDDTNYMADADWQPYPGSNVNVNLGSTEGWHLVWIGLRGFPTNATQTWQSLQVDLDLTPPVLTITSPTTSVTSQPIVELQGMSDRPISQISFDIENDAGTNTDLSGTVTGQVIDPNTSHFTSNAFQCFDLPLANGLNTITVRVTDLAGNMATTNLALTLDLSSDTNPPAITLFWPQNGDTIAGTEFTLRGSLDDFTASLTAQIVDTNGNTNVISATIERNGLYWVENVPLAAGTNYITLTAMDAAGNIAVTNITVNNISSALTISNFSSGLGGDPRNIIPTVTGTISLTNYTLWVNGIQAVQSNGAWEASSIPLSSGGTAVIEVRAIPNSDNGGNGTGTTQPSDGTPVNPTATNSIAAETQIDQPTIVYLQQYRSSSSLITISSNVITQSQVAQLNADYGQGGTASRVDMEMDGSGNGYNIFYSTASWPCDQSYSDQCPINRVVTCSNCVTQTYSESLFEILKFTQPYRVAPIIEFEEIIDGLPPVESNFNVHYVNGSTGYNANDNISTQLTLQTGGKGTLTDQNLFQIYYSPASYAPTQVGLAVPTWSQVSILPGQMTVGGAPLDTTNTAYVGLPNNVTMDITPQLPSPLYTYQAYPVGPEQVPITLSVISGGAAQVGTNNDWAVVKGSGYVTVQASCSNTNLLPKLQWNTGLGSLGNSVLPKWQRLIPISTSAKIPVTASVGGNKGSLNLWVVWANLSVNVSGTLDTNDHAALLYYTNSEYLWPTPADYNIDIGNDGLGGGNGLGPIDCTTNSNLNYAFTVGKIEAKAIPEPTGICSLVTNWYLQRTRFAIAWDNGGTPDLQDDPTNGHPDQSANYSEYLSKTNGEVFDLDAPGCSAILPGTSINHTAEVYENFYEYLTVDLGNGPQTCSPMQTWSYEARVDADASTNKTQMNSLNSSFISLPTNAFFLPR